MSTKRGRSIMPDAKIEAVAEMDLETLLKSLGELDRIQAGEARCVYCDKVITLKNLHAIIPDDSQVRYCCDSDLCIATMTWGGTQHG